MKNKQFAHEYWSRTELGRKMIASDRVSDSDLLFLIPNNVKRMHGLPPTRTFGRNKSELKRLRKRYIHSFKLFEIIEELVDDMLTSKFKDEEFFQEFVEFKNVNYGDTQGVNYGGANL